MPSLSPGLCGIRYATNGHLESDPENKITMTDDKCSATTTILYTHFTFTSLFSSLDVKHMHYGFTGSTTRRLYSLVTYKIRSGHSPFNAGNLNDPYKSNQEFSSSVYLVHEPIKWISFSISGAHLKDCLHSSVPRYCWCYSQKWVY
jgi:hypothetical protein